MHRLVFFSFFPLVVGGCSWRFATEDDRAGRPENAPVVAITPLEPSTVDDLVAAVVEPSRSSAGPVAYRYAWACSPDCGTHVGEMVPASLTAKGQTWTVTVTPHFGVLDGPAATASVTVRNSAPTLRAGGLERYDVWSDDVLLAFVEHVEDADGDAVAIRYAWTLDGAVLDEVGDRLALTTRATAPGSEIEVVIVGSDGEAESAPITVGPAIVRPDGGFRPLEPNKATRQIPQVVFADDENARLLRIHDGELWEYRPGAPHHGWARLHVRGLPDVYAPLVLHDTVRRRFLVFGGVDYTDGSPNASNTLLEIAVPQRGRETVRVVPQAGEWPSPRAYASGVIDRARDRALVYGGGEPDPLPITWNSVSSELWSLDLSHDDPVFTRLVEDAVPGGLIGSAFVVDTARDSAYLIGGNRVLPNVAASSSVYRLDLTSDTFETQIVASLPSTRSGSGVVQGSDGAYLLGGSSEANSVTGVDPLFFDFATRIFSQVALGAALPVTVFPSILSLAPGRIVHASNARVGVDVDWEVHEVDLVSGAVTRLEETGATTPGPFIDAGVLVEDGPTGRPVLVFGSTPSYPRITLASAFAWSGGRWAAVPAYASPSFARHGALRVFGLRDTHAGLFGGLRGAGTTTARIWDMMDAIGTPASLRTLRPAPPTLPEDFPTSLAGGFAWSMPCGAGFYDAVSEHVWRAVGDTYERVPASDSRAPYAMEPISVSLEVAGAHRIVVFPIPTAGPTESPVRVMDACAPHAASPEAHEGFSSPTVLGTPPAARGLGAAVAIPGPNTNVAARALVFGGEMVLSDLTTVVDDVHLVELVSPDTVRFTPLPTGEDVPPARSHHVVLWDRATQRMIITGGQGLASNVFGPGVEGATSLADTWEYRLPPGL